MRSSLVVLSLSGIGLALLAGTVMQAQPQGQAPPSASAERAAMAGVAAEGRVVAYPGAEVTIGADAVGRLLRVNVEEGDLVKKGRVLAQTHKCVFCHGADLDGGQGVPRIGGQKEDYLRMTLHGYKSGDRAAYTRAMPEALSQVAVEDLDLLAYYVANFTGK